MSLWHLTDLYLLTPTPRAQEPGSASKRGIRRCALSAGRCWLRSRDDRHHIIHIYAESDSVYLSLDEPPCLLPLQKRKDIPTLPSSSAARRISARHHRHQAESECQRSRCARYTFTNARAVGAGRRNGKNCRAATAAIRRRSATTVCVFTPAASRSPSPKSARPACGTETTAAPAPKTVLGVRGRQVRRARKARRRKGVDRRRVGGPTRVGVVIPRGRPRAPAVKTRGVRSR